MMMKPYVAIPILLLSLFIAFIVAGLPYWAVFIATLSLVLLVFELYLMIKYKTTLSDRFYMLYINKRRMSYLIFAIFIAFVAYLALHLTGRF